MDKFKYKKLEQTKNRFKYEATVLEGQFESKRIELFKVMSKSVKIPGFRPGMGPKAEIEKQIAYSVYIETINRVIPEVAMEVLKQEKLNPISSLNYELVEAAKDEKDIKFTFDFLNQPDIDTSKLARLKVDKKNPDVTDTEVIDVVKNLIKSTLPREKWEKYIIKTPQITKKESKAKDENEKSNAQGEASEDIELNDELIKELGYEDEKDLAGVKSKVKETLTNLKIEQNQGEFNSKLIEEALKAADFEVPHEYIHKEVEEREAQFTKRLRDLKLNEEVYLRTQGKTMKDLRNEWHEQSEMDLSTDLLLINIAVKDKKLPTDEEVEAEIEKMDDQSKKHYKDEKNKDYLRTALTRNNGLKRLVELNEKK